MWNDDSGDWQGLSSATERPRYLEIARVICEVCPSGAVLDVGCGEAILAQYLPESITYTGIEPSAKALKLAAAGARCHHMTAEDFVAGGERWDCIIFNEMLYYSRDPRALLQKFAMLLQGNGIIVVSIYQKRDSWSARLRLSMTNRRCTRIVKEFIVHERWNVELDKRIGQFDSEPWWLLVARP